LFKSWSLKWPGVNHPRAEHWNPAGLTGRLRHRGLNVESRALARPLNSDSSRLHPSHHENHSPPPHLRRRPVAICGRRVCMPHGRRVTVCMPHGRRASVCMPRRVPHTHFPSVYVSFVCARALGDEEGFRGNFRLRGDDHPGGTRIGQCGRCGEAPIAARISIAESCRAS
jgi:hypothetical protein